MLVVLSFHNGDKTATTLLAEWIATLGGVKSHELMLVLHVTVDPAGVIEPLQRAFSKVFMLRVSDPDPGKWPEGPNLMFRRAARQIEATSPQPWLWLEPDAIPLTARWLDEIEAAYKLCDSRHPFMGVRVELPNIIAHMSGVAVYPGNAPSLAPLLVTCKKVAFDVNSQSEVLPRLTPTALIQHDWKPATFATAADLARIRPGVVLYHQCKDSSLIKLLREGRTPETLEVGDGDLRRDLPAPAAGGASTGGGEIVEPDDDLTPEQLVEHHVGQLKNLAAAGHSRAVSMYLTAAGLAAASPAPAPKAKKQPRKKAEATVTA